MKTLLITGFADGGAYIVWLADNYALPLIPLFALNDVYGKYGCARLVRHKRRAALKGMYRILFIVVESALGENDYHSSLFKTGDDVVECGHREVLLIHHYAVHLTEEPALKLGIVKILSCKAVHTPAGKYDVHRYGIDKTPMIRGDHNGAARILISVRAVYLRAQPQKHGERSRYLNEIVAEIIKRFLPLLAFQALFRVL